MAQELAGKVAVITGAAKGLGRETARLFVEEGAQVVIADLDPQGEAAAASLGAAARFKRTDVSNPDEVQALVDYAVAEFGGLHVMFNNAGISSAMTRLLDDPLTDFHRVMGVNVLGVMTGTQRAARHMARHGGGSIINTASIAGVHAGAGLVTYRASKAAVAHFTKVAAIDLGEHDIRVNCILPGNVETGMLSASLGADMTPAQIEVIERGLTEMRFSIQPLKRRGAPIDVARAALYLASERAAYVTGMLFPVDGGVIAGDARSQMGALDRIREAAAKA
jgi:NAD(P)-dependent dehydrogenase (short-subunit alcohol dehydrogenase family)